MAKSGEPSTKRTVSLFTKLSLALLLILSSLISVSVALRTGDLWLGFSTFLLVWVGVVFVLTMTTLTIFGAVMVHEAGHVVGGLLAKLKFRRVDAMGVSLARGPDGFSLGFRWTPGVGGLCLMDPTSGGDLAKRYRLCILGGPLASLASGILLVLLVAVLAPMAANPLVAWIRFLLLAPIIANLGFGLANLIPFQSQGYMTDGMLIALLSKGGPAGRRVLSHYQVSAASRAGVRPRDWDVTFIEALDEPRDASLGEVYARQGRYAHFLDLEEFDAARRELERAHEISVTLKPSQAGQAPAMVGYERAFFATFHEGDLEGARAAMPASRVTGGFIEDVETRAYLAIAIAANQREEAEKQFENLKAVRLKLMKGGVHSLDSTEFFGKIADKISAIKD